MLLSCYSTVFMAEVHYYFVLSEFMLFKFRGLFVSACRRRLILFFSSNLLDPYISGIRLSELRFMFGLLDTFVCISLLSRKSS